MIQGHLPFASLPNELQCVGFVTLTRSRFVTCIPKLLKENKILRWEESKPNIALYKTFNYFIGYHIRCLLIIIINNNAMQVKSFYFILCIELVTPKLNI